MGQFIAHSDLGYNAANKTQYLKDDFLIILVVKVEPKIFYRVHKHEYLKTSLSYMCLQQVFPHFNLVMTPSRGPTFRPQALFYEYDFSLSINGNDLYGCVLVLTWLENQFVNCQEVRACTLYIHR